MSGPDRSKKQIAILGGGMAALTAAFELSSTPELRNRYAITVYQMGWRLGGKGASGRNAKKADRIEEHGLHVLMGFYHNAFKMLRACYEELGRAPGTPLATLDEAVKPHSFIAVTEEVAGRWETWPMLFPHKPGLPGEGASDILSPLDSLKKLLAWMNGVFTSSPETQQIAPDIALDIADVERDIDGPSAPKAKARQVDNHAGGRSLEQHEPPDTLPGRTMDDESEERRIRVENFVDDLYAARRIVPPLVYLHLANLLTKYRIEDPGPKLVWLLQKFWTWLRKSIKLHPGVSTILRRLWLLLDLGIATLVGALEDGVLTAPDGWLSLDEVDLRAWLARHGASELACDSALVRAIYNAAFTGPGQAAAGTAIHGTLRLLFDYKQAIFHKMQAGMGDTIFAPLYLVLKRRGVRFEFFHRVDELVLSSDRRRIASVTMGRQARPKGEEYDPLYDVGGLPCWPSLPRFEELEGGAELEASGQNLESWWNTWPDVEHRSLEAGKDFDALILGIGIGAFPSLCKELIAASKPFADMVKHVKTTQTQAAQLWLSRDLAGLGWLLESPVLDGYAEPFDSWGDMTHLLQRERWVDGAPRSIAYLCGRLEDDEAPPSRGENPFPERERARTKANVMAWLTKEARGLWPGAADPESRVGFDWSVLVDPEDREGAGRLEAQYWQATFSPSERYVLSAPGSRRYRLRAHESGFTNLALAGDWVKTGMSMGCVEAAVMAGMQASRAISGRPRIIPGDD